MLARLRLAIPALLLLLAAVPESRAEQPAGRAYTVAAIGDSLTDPRSQGGKYLETLRARCPESRFDGYGKGGQMVNQMRRRFARDVLGDPPDPEKPKPRYSHVIVFGGVNDLVSDLTAGRTPKKIARDLSTMYQAAREHGIQVIAVTVSPWGGFRKWFNPKRGKATLKLNDWILAQRDAGVVDHVIDAYSLLSCGNPERLCKDFTKPFNDGLHFGPAAHELLAAALQKEAFSDCR